MYNFLKISLKWLACITEQFNVLNLLNQIYVCYFLLEYPFLPGPGTDQSGRYCQAQLYYRVIRPPTHPPTHIRTSSWTSSLIQMSTPVSNPASRTTPTLTLAKLKLSPAQPQFVSVLFKKGKARLEKCPQKLQLIKFFSFLGGGHSAQLRKIQRLRKILNF